MLQQITTFCNIIPFPNEKKVVGAFSQNLKVPNQFYFQLFFTGGHCPDVRQRLREEPPDAEPDHDPRSHPGHGQERQQEEQLGAVVDGTSNDRHSDYKDRKEIDRV
jgi:hypothetical protein